MKAIGRGIVGLAAAVAVAVPAFAHGVRLPLAQWGQYEPAVLHCQRVVARAAARCAQEAWAARRACRTAELTGGTCDADATRARVVTARLAAQDAAEAACSERQMIAIQFLGQIDLLQDLTDYCRAWQEAAESAVFGHGSGDAACVRAAADAATDLFAGVTRARRRAMDRVAASQTGAAQRPAWLAAADRDVERLATRAAETLAARCPQLAARLGRDAQAFVAPLRARADCIGGAFYIQDAVLCAPATCGNFVTEPPAEECDDGNPTGGDGCSAECLVE